MDEMDPVLVGLRGVPFVAVASSTLVVLLAAELAWESAISSDCRFLRAKGSGFLDGSGAGTSLLWLAAASETVQRSSSSDGNDGN